MCVYDKISIQYLYSEHTSECENERERMNSGSESTTQKWEWADYNNRSDKKNKHKKYHSVGDDKSYS